MNLHPARAATRRALARVPGPGAITIALGVAAALGGAALYNRAQARRAERDHPPVGRFLEVDGTRLHYLDEGPADNATRGVGEERPVVLLHGNTVTLDDWIVSGVFDLVARSRRVVAFDRPGFGYSERPRDRSWTPAAQARLLRRACRRLGVERPVVVGHSWATLVALAWALQAPHEIAGLVLASGYYYPSRRLDVVLATPGAVPLLGDVLNHTVSPPLTQMTLPGILRKMFAPRPVPNRFSAAFPRALISRPGQIRAMSQEGAIMVPSAAALRRHYGGFSCPSMLMTGEADRVVDPEDQSIRLAHELNDAELRIIPGAGHMFHHAVPLEMAEAIDRVASGRGRRQEVASCAGRRQSS
jgi:pimeloyl-ACP methyl ester carboxylesterase